MSTTECPGRTVGEICRALNESDKRVRRAIARLRIEPAARYAGRFAVYSDNDIEALKIELRRTGR